MKIKIELLCKNGVKTSMPQYMSEQAAGFDLSAAIDEDITLEPFERTVVPAGFKMEIPKGYVGLIFIRSSLGMKHGITLPNSVGVIDSDYRGEIGVAVVNLSKEAFKIEKNMRIAQMCIVPVLNMVSSEPAQLVECDDLSNTARGEGGFGSTGKN